jgi:hypothetical protein
MAQFVKCVAESFALSDAFRDRSGSKWADRHCAVLSVVVRLVATPYDVFFSSHFIGQTLVASELRECNGVFPNTFFQLRRRFQCSNPRSPSRYWPAQCRLLQPTTIPAPGCKLLCRARQDGHRLVQAERLRSQRKQDRRYQGCSGRQVRKGSSAHRRRRRLPGCGWRRDNRRLLARTRFL